MSDERIVGRHFPNEFIRSTDDGGEEFYYVDDEGERIPDGEAVVTIYYEDVPQVRERADSSFLLNDVGGKDIFDGGDTQPRPRNRNGR